MFTQCVNDDIIFIRAASPGYNENIWRGWRLAFPVVCRGYQHTPLLYCFLIHRHETEQVYGHGCAVCGLWSERSLSVFSGLSQWRQGLGFQSDYLHANLYPPRVLYFWITVSTHQLNSWHELDPMGSLEIQLSTEVEGWVHHTILHLWVVLHLSKTNCGPFILQGFWVTSTCCTDNRKNL